MGCPHYCQDTVLIALDTRRAVLQRARDAVLYRHGSQLTPLVQELAVQRVRELVGPALRAQVACLAAPSLAVEIIERAAGTRVLESHAVLGARIAAARNHGTLLHVVLLNHGLEAGLLGLLCRLLCEPRSARRLGLGGGLLCDPIKIEVAPATIALPLQHSELAHAATVAEGAIAEGHVLDERTLRAHLRDDEGSHFGQANQTPPTRSNYRDKAAGG